MLSRPPVRRLSSSVAAAAGVAVAYLALAIPHGGFAPEVVAAATILVWWAVIAALIVRGRSAAVTGAALACGVTLAILAVLSAASLAWASDDGRGYVDVVRVAGYVGLFALVIVATPPATLDLGWSGWRWASRRSRSWRWEAASSLRCRTVAPLEAPRSVPRAA